MKLLLSLALLLSCAETHFPWVREIPYGKCVLGERFVAPGQDCACKDVKQWPTNTRITYYDACDLVCSASIYANACIDDRGDTWSACAWNSCGMFGDAVCKMGATPAETGGRR